MYYINHENFNIVDRGFNITTKGYALAICTKKKSSEDVHYPLVDACMRATLSFIFLSIHVEYVQFIDSDTRSDIVRKETNVGVRAVSALDN